MDNLVVFVPISKIDAKKQIIYGTAADETPDRAKEVFDYETSKPYFKTWSESAAKATNGKSVGNVRAMHGAVAAGKLSDIGFDDAAKRIQVAAHIVDANEWKKVEEGVYTGLSIAGKYVKRWDDGDLKRYTADPVEISLVDLPCNPGATFEVVKADGTTEMRKFHVPAAEPGDEPTNDAVADEARSLAKADGKADAWLAYVEKARSNLKAKNKHGKGGQPEGHGEGKAGQHPGEQHGGAEAVASGEETQEDDDENVAPGNKAADGDWEQVWQSVRLPGKTFKKKAALITALTELDADEAAKKGAAPAIDALKGLTDALDAKDGGQTRMGLGTLIAGGKYDEAISKAYALGAVVKLAEHCSPELIADLNKTVVVVGKDGAVDFSAIKEVVVPIILEAVQKKEFSDEKRKQLAGEGKAMKDGSYPIESKSDLKNAVQAYGRAKNKAAAKRHIIRRAKALGATSMLPDDWNVKTVEPVDMAKFATDDLKASLKKAATLYGVACLVQLLAQIDSAEEGLESPDWGYGTAVPKDLCDRFGTLLVEFGDIVAEVLDECLQQIREEEGEEAADMVARCDAAIELSKAVVDFPLVKAGARHSKLDQNRLNDAHDLLVDAGAQCDATDDSEKAGTAANLRKQIGARDKAFAKTMDGVVGTIQDIAERVKRIEAQPLPEGTTHYRAVEKGGDVDVDFDVVGDLASPAHLKTIEVASDMARFAARRF